MSDMKTYEYIWLDGYTPEPLRSGAKATEEKSAPTGHLMVHLLNKQREEAQTVFFFLFKLILIQMDTI